MLTPESSRYQRGFIDFFEDELARNGYDWRKLIEDYLCTGKEPLINSIFGGRTQPSLLFPPSPSTSPTYTDTSYQ